MNRFLAPVLSAQFITQATGRQFEILTLVPEREPLPFQRKNIMLTGNTMSVC